MNYKFIFTNIIRVLFLVLLQVTLLNVLPINRFYIMIYPLAILLLPMATPKALVVVIGFVVGFIVDWLSNTSGLHTASLTLMAYSRSFILDNFQPKSGWDKLDVPNVKQQGYAWFFYYTLICFFIHHFAFFFLEVFSFHHFLHTLLKFVLSLASSLILMWLLTLSFFKSNEV
ncbi:MAG: hypothetical protein H6553_01570 [Chitinophagales bacterium]|nr:hypothetical protein [Chitinophagales bacterium]